MRENARNWLAIAWLGLLALGSEGLWRQTRAQAVGFQPVVSSFPSGVTLGVTPAVSADRRYVRMSLGVTFTDLLGFDTFLVPAAVSGGFGGVEGVGGGLGGVAGMNAGGGAAGGGFRATGLGDPRAPGGEIPEGLATMAADPFTEALHSPITTPSAEGTIVAPSNDELKS